MRKVTLLIGSAILALALPVHAEPTGAPPPATEQPFAGAASADGTTTYPAPQRRFQVGISYLPMAMGKIKSQSAGTTDTADGAFASGVGLSASFNIFRGLMVGLAPQAIYKGKVKADPVTGQATKFGTDTQYDLLLRLAYAYSIPDVVTLYAEVLPGYSILYPSTQDTSKGLVIVYGIGAEVDVSKRVFANLGVGYQMGYQKESVGFYRNTYVRGNVGVGMRF